MSTSDKNSKRSDTANEAVTFKKIQVFIFQLKLIMKLSNPAAFVCSKSTIGTLAQGAKFVQR